MAAVTPCGSIWNTTAGVKTTATLSPTPASGTLLVAVVGVAAVDTAPTMSDNKGGAWTLVDSFRSYGSAITGGLRIYVRNTACDGTSMSVTMTPSGDGGGGLFVLSVTDPAAFGASAVRSTGGQADQASGTPAPVLGSTPLSKNPVIIAVMTQTNGTANATVRTGYTEDYDLGFNTPPSGMEVQHRDSGETSATLTTGGAAPSGFASIGIEIATITRVTLGIVSETDAPQAPSIQKTVALPTVSESQSAVAGQAAKALGVTQASETDAAIALSSFIDSAKNLTPIVQTNTAVPLSFGKALSLTPAAETSAAQPETASKALGVTAAGEADAAVAQTAFKTVVLVAATETDSGVALSVTKPIVKTITTAAETDSAQPRSFAKSLALTPATETDQAVPLSISGGDILKALQPVTTTDTAPALSFTKTIFVSVAPAAESDSAQALSYEKPIQWTLSPVADSTTVVPLTIQGPSFVPTTEAVAGGARRGNVGGSVARGRGGAVGSIRRGNVS
jgi:hypothetical protein